MIELVPVKTHKPYPTHRPKAITDIRARLVSPDAHKRNIRRLAGSLGGLLAFACGGPDVSNSGMNQAELSVRADPPGQMFAEKLQVSLISSRPAEIFYTLDGSQPSANSSSAIEYAGTIALTEQTLLSFVAVSTDGTWSSSQEELYLKPNSNPPPTPAPRMLSLSSQALFFEAKPGSSEPIYKTVALRSVGTEAVNVTSIRLQSNPNQSIFYDPDAFDIVSEVPIGPLAPGESIVVELMYIPSDTLRSDVLRISSNEQRSGGEQQIELWGRVADW